LFGRDIPEREVKKVLDPCSKMKRFPKIGTVVNYASRKGKNSY
jgi:hypothetical protein